jgi:diketogulonate reductase-like aldo/keto reductase
VEKVKTLDFLTRDMTLGQAALKWLLAEPLVVTTLPNIYDDEQLAEFAAASDKPDLTAEQLARVAELDETNFGVDEAPMTYKGAMTRERGANLDLQHPRNPTGRPLRAEDAARAG